MFTAPEGFPPHPNNNKKGNESILCFPVIGPEIVKDYLHTEQTKSDLSLLLKKKNLITNYI